MTWIIFDNVHVWKLIHVCYLCVYYFSDSRRSCHSCRIWNSIAYFPDFTVGTDEKIYEWVYKTNIDCSFIRGMVEYYCTLGKIQTFPTIHLGPTGLGE